VKVLVCGSNGSLGRVLLANAPNQLQIIGLDHKQLDITNSKVVSEQIKFYSPQLIINASAFTNVDLAQSNKKIAFAVNAFALKNLARFNIPIIHISTDYVFAGNKYDSYIESDVTYPLNIYGKSKLAGEKLLIKNNPLHIIVRSSWLFGVSGNNFLTKVLKIAQNNCKIKMVTDQIGNPTSYVSLAKALWQLVLLYQKNRDLKWGIYHYASSNYCSRYDFTQFMLDKAYEYKILKLIPKLIAISSQDYTSAVVRPLNCTLNSELFGTTFNIELPNWHNDLTNIFSKR